MNKKMLEKIVSMFDFIDEDLTELDRWLNSQGCVLEEYEPQSDEEYIVQKSVFDLKELIQKLNDGIGK